MTYQLKYWYNLKLGTTNIPIGKTGTYSFELTNKEKKKNKFRVEYAIHYLTSTGKTSKKVFQIAEKVLDAGEKINFKRNQRFTDFTTRKHFPGKHRLEIIVNGEVKQALNFKLI